MPKCQNCGEHVTEKYVQIFCPPERDDPKACPHCPDLMRVGTDVRAKGSYEDIDEGEI